MAGSKTRVIFQNSNLFVAPAGPSGLGATGSFYSSGNSGFSYIAELSRIQSIDLSVGIARQDINVFGRLNRIDSEILSPPSIGLNFSYFLTDGLNEHLLGFAAKGGASFISGLLTNVSDSKNYLVSYSPQGQDDDGYSSSDFQRDMVGVGNCYISNYSINAGVGQPVTASVSVEGLNIAFYTGCTGKTTPAVNPSNSARINDWTFTLPVGQAQTGGSTISIIKPGDITMTIPNGLGFGSVMSGDFAANVQSFTLSVPIGRQRVQKLGSPFGISNEIQFPVNCSLSIQALQTNFQQTSLDQLLCNDQPQDVRIAMRQPSCNGTGMAAVNIQFNNCYINNYSVGQTIGGDASLSIDATAQLSGPLSLEGLVFSGFY
jgi:hypothetical protein